MKHLSLLLFGTPILLVGCTAILGGDTSGGSVDAQVDNEVDATVTVDAAVPPDAASPPDAVPLAACDDTYSTAPGYILCPAFTTDTACGFNVTTAQEACQVVCPRFGGACIGALDNPGDPGLECTVMEPNLDDCTTTGRSTEICVCARVPVGSTGPLVRRVRSTGGM